MTGKALAEHQEASFFHIADRRLERALTGFQTGVVFSLIPTKSNDFKWLLEK
jgi:hypothetical protein